MSYNNRNPIFSFRLGLYRHQKLNDLAKSHKLPAKDFIRKIIDQYLAGELIDKPKSNLNDQMMLLRVEKLKQEIRYLKIKNDFAETFDAPMPVSQQRMLKPAIIKTSENDFQLSPYDASNKRLQCTECGALFTWNSVEAYLEALKEYPLHIRSRHGRELN